MAGQSCWLLLTLALKGVLASDWRVRLPSEPVCAVIGSSVVLPCSYDYPDGAEGEGRLPATSSELEAGAAVVAEMWCLEHRRCVTPRYVFHSDGVFPEPSYRDRVTYLGTPGNKSCSLRISDLRASDSGTYVFYLVTNHTAQKMPEQSGVQLLVADSSGAVAASASPSRSDVIEGGAVRLACCSPAAKPGAAFRWYKDGGGGGAALRHSGQMWNISKTASGDSGGYFCQMQSGDQIQNSAVLNINVQYPPRNTTVSVWPSAELEAGLPVTLTCSSDASPPVRTFMWYRGAACAPTADKSAHRGRQSKVTAMAGRALSSINVTADADGRHCCVARNTHGWQSDTVTLSSSRVVNSPDSTKGKKVFIGVAIGVLLAAIAIAAFIVSRKKKTSRHRSYALTETTSVAP